MHEAKIKFQNEIQPDIKHKIEHHINYIKWLIPTWVQDVNIWYQPAAKFEAENCSAEISIDLKYRYVSINIFPLWYSRNFEEQREDLIHEFLHMSINRIHDYAKEQLEILMPDAPNYRKSITETLTGELEKAVSDLTYLIYNKMENS